MAYKLIEDVVDALKVYLEQNLPAKLVSLTAEYADEVVLEDIKQWTVAELPALENYPTVAILGDDTSVTGEGEGWLASRHAISIIVVLGDQNPELLRRRLYRYVRALVELLKAARSSTGWSYVITFERILYSVTYTRESQFLSGARIIIRAGKSEVA